MVCLLMCRLRFWPRQIRDPVDVGEHSRRRAESIAAASALGPDRSRGEEGTGDLGEDHGDVAVGLIVCHRTSKLSLTPLTHELAEVDFPLGIVLASVTRPHCCTGANVE